MPINANLLLSVGLVLGACAGDSGLTDDSTSLQGTLVISTVTTGGDPDQDGYLLTIDGLDPVPLSNTGKSEMELRSGKHTLVLSGVAEHCSVTPANDVEVEVPPRATISVAFDVSCPASAVRITTSTTGLDLDPDGYRIVVNGTDREGIPSNGTVLTQLDPGDVTIDLTGLAPNCTSARPLPRTLTIEDPVVAPIEFAVVCTATSAVIRISVESPGHSTNGVMEATLDGRDTLLVDPGEWYYFNGVSGGSHVVSLFSDASGCSDPEPQTVELTVGWLVRDTAEVNFSVTCSRLPDTVGTVRITAPTRGPVPDSTQYVVWAESYGYWDYGGESTPLGMLHPNDSLVVQLPASGPVHYWYVFRLNVPTNCRARNQGRFQYMIPAGGVVDVEFAVTCTP